MSCDILLFLEQCHHGCLKKYRTLFKVNFSLRAFYNEGNIKIVQTDLLRLFL